MSRRSGNRGACVVLAAVLALTAACGTSGSRPAVSSGRAPIDAEGALPDGGSLAPPESRSPAPPVEVPERAKASYSRALEAMTEADWTEAELELEQLISEYPDYPGPYVNLAILHRRNGRSGEAEASLQRALAVAPDHPAANSELGVLHRERGEFDEAEAAYRRAIDADPDYALAHYNLGVLLDVYRQRAAEALEHYEAYQSLRPDADPEVARWILDLRRRFGLPESTEQTAQENGT